MPADLDWGGGIMDGEKLMDSRYVLKVEWTDFVNGLYVGEEEGGNNSDFWILGLIS